MMNLMVLNDILKTDITFSPYKWHTVEFSGLRRRYNSCEFGGWLWAMRDGTIHFGQAIIFPEKDIFPLPTDGVIRYCTDQLREAEVGLHAVMDAGLVKEAEEESKGVVA